MSQLKIKLFEKQWKHSYQQFMHYGISVIISGIINFLPVFVLVRLLPPAAYTNIVLAKNTLFLLVSIAGLGISQSVVRWVNTFSDRSVYVNSLIAVSFFALPANLVLCLILAKLLHYHINVLTFSFIFLLLLLQLINFEIINWQRAEHQSAKFAAFTAYRGLFQITGIIVAIYLYKTLFAYFTGLLIAEILFIFLVGFKQITKHVRKFEVSLNLIWEMFSFGWPNAFIIANGILLNTLDRYMLEILQANHKLVAFYDAGYILASAGLYLLGRAFNTYLFPAYMKAHKDQGENACITLIDNMIRVYLIIGFLITTVVICFKQELFTILFPPSYKEALPIVMPICIGAILNGLNSGLSAGLYIANKSWKISLTSGIALIINIIMNFIVIPHYGMLGAAYSTLITFMVQTLLIYNCAKSYLKIKLPLSYLLAGVISVCFFNLIIFG